jgi:hypothetical protein
MSMDWPVFLTAFSLKRELFSYFSEETRSFNLFKIVRRETREPLGVQQLFQYFHGDCETFQII